MKINLNKIALLAPMAISIGGFAQGQTWTLVDDFESGYTVGQTISGINGWLADLPTSALAGDDPLGIENGTALRLVPNAVRNDVSRPLPAGSEIADNTVGTIFFELYLPNAAVGANFNIGLSDAATPDNFAAFKPQLRLLGENISPRSGSGFINTPFNFPSGTWLQVWLVCDHTNDTADMYMQSPNGSVGQILVADDFAFRAPTTVEALSTFYTIQTNSQEVFIDNIYIDNGSENLANPAFIDSDGDGMSDPWEQFYFGDLSQAGSTNFDSDGLSNVDEFIRDTDPTNSDTDGDTLLDGPELDGSSNAFDGASTDPRNADSDGDGVNDFEENGSLNTAFANAPTNPNAADTDGDGIPDGYELANNTPSTALNPNDDGSLDPSQLPTGDRDGDLLSNIGEFDPLQGINTSSVQTRADIADTDDDGYSDYAEDNTGNWVDITQTGSNPTNADTDGDGLEDGEENLDLSFTAGAIPTNSDPNLRDTDLDGFIDSFEVNADTDPNNNGDSPTQAAGFTLIEDFEGEGMVIGSTFDGVNGWSSMDPEAIEVVDEPIEGNDQIGCFTSTLGKGAIATYKQLDTAGFQVSDTNVGTLFFQVYGSTQNMDHSIGLTDVPQPAGFGDFEAQTVLYSESVVRVRDETAFRDVSTYAVKTWINVWIVADNTSDTVKVYLENPSSETEQIEITDDGGVDPFGFRNGTTDALRSLLVMIAEAAEDDQPLYLDNFYLDPSAANLTTPAAAKPITVTPDDLVITNTVLNANGDFEITFTPGGPGYILTSASPSELETATFTDQANYSYDSVDTFTVPAAFVTANPGFFFRVEETP